MKYLNFVLTGIFFGIIMAKSEVISWFRIYEMFHFESFHMYGVIGSAVAVGIIGNILIKKLHIKTIEGTEVDFCVKEKTYPRYILGGSIFGLGWALIGACPGPMFVLLGFGYYSISIVILGALIGTFLYGILRNKLPH
ncbi:MAG: putative membrane protein YedE/YeeE [Limisphaerales bacterium]|jgi:uncharacterized membrane protein YedE/YeeE